MNNLAYDRLLYRVKVIVHRNLLALVGFLFSLLPLTCVQAQQPRLGFVDLDRVAEATQIGERFDSFYRYYKGLLFKIGQYSLERFQNRLEWMEQYYCGCEPTCHERIIKDLQDKQQFLINLEEIFQTLANWVTSNSRRLTRNLVSRQLDMLIREFQLETIIFIRPEISKLHLTDATDLTEEVIGLINRQPNTIQWIKKERNRLAKKILDRTACFN